jgi:hypothetical protein
MTNQYLWARVVGHDPDLRAADADRERIAERLRKSHAEGRLDLTEFQQRLEHAYKAKTFGELAELVSDLPRQEIDDERRAFRGFGPWRWRLARLAPILIALVVFSAVVEHPVFLFWIPLAFLFWRMSAWRRRRWFAAARRQPGDWI